MVSIQTENDKQRAKMKKQAKEFADVESQHQTLNSQKKQLTNNLESAEEERDMYNSNYKKLY